ncbi:MAG: GNAT family N-acetyltransferase [Clostridia bacterium]|nr:GNAT family N-acetyltransferase [Clostridia bacterium]
MEIRRANENDIKEILRLLSQVLEIHAGIRPDIFIPGTTKYTEAQLLLIIKDENRPVFVAKEGNRLLGYAFCVIEKPAFETTMKPIKSLYIDDLCVDESARGGGVGKALFEFVKNKAKELGLGEITLAVWEGNDNARAFYEKMGMTPKETIMEIKLS